MNITFRAILAERMRLQRLTEPLTAPEEYVKLFRLLQPVSTVHNACPGDPPSLRPRTHFDDAQEANRLRAQHAIVKGRFLGGRIGYVLADDLWIYANAFQRPLNRLNEIQRTVFRTLQSTGPLAPRQIKEETGLLNKQIMPALHRLQKAFLVYEDQVDSDWERGWYSFTSEWPEIELSEKGFKVAARQVLCRFLEGHVFATYEQLKDWSQLPGRSLTTLLQEMEDAGIIAPRAIGELGEGWMLCRSGLSTKHDVGPSVFMLHKADYLVRSHASELKRRFRQEEVLQYLLIDGKFHGAVLGHWRIGPHDVSDIAVHLPAPQRTIRRKEILAVVGRRYGPPHSRILRYAGRTLAKIDMPPTPPKDAK